MLKSSTVEYAIKALQTGQPIIIVDDEDRENEGDLVYPAECINEQIMTMMIRYGSGIVCLALTEAYSAKLHLPLMVTDNTSKHRTAFTVSIEAKHGVTTGVSAKDRVTTILTAVSDQAKPEDLARPGHVFPLLAAKGGVRYIASSTCLPPLGSHHSSICRNTP
jgi:3,4-dihydroxy 2-butanone 4-phosphate synthase